MDSSPPHSAAPLSPSAQEQDMQKWIQESLEHPLNLAESNSDKSIQDYDELASVWDHTFLTKWNHFKDVKLLTTELRPHLSLDSNTIVLDLGGATGKLAKFLVQMGLARKVISVDISPKMTERAQQEFKSLNQSTENDTGKPVPWELVAICADMAVPIENQPRLKELLSDGVDVVISLRAFATLPPTSAAQTLKTIRTVLRPNGRILLDNNPPRPFLRHVVCIPKAFKASQTHPSLVDLIIHGFIGRSVLVFDNESPALVALQTASLNHLARESGLKLQHITHGYLPEGAVDMSTRFLSHVRDQLKEYKYDKFSAPPKKVVEVLEKTSASFFKRGCQTFIPIWREEAGVETNLDSAWVGHQEESVYYGVFSMASSTD
jgi:SAM-dependent methyltransferase